MAFNLGTTVDLCMAYTLMVTSMTLTLTQGHNGSAKTQQNQRWIILPTKHAIGIELAFNGRPFFVRDLDFENVYMACSPCSLLRVQPGRGVAPCWGVSTTVPPRARRAVHAGTASTWPPTTRNASVSQPCLQSTSVSFDVCPHQVDIRPPPKK